MSIYARGAEAYLAAEWRGILPLPTGKKANPPKGWTGYGAPDPTERDVRQWIGEDQGLDLNQNLALRMSALANGMDIVAIDIDAYKGGGDTYQNLKHELGPMGNTWSNSARFDTDPVSGHYYYLTPHVPNYKGEAETGPGMDILNHHHRYSVAWPSTNPDAEGRVYRFRNPDGIIVPEGIVPNPMTFPRLRESWREFIIASRERVQAKALSYREVSQYLKACRAADTEHPQCGLVKRGLEKALKDLAAGRPSRHAVARNWTRALAGYGGEGHIGAPEALDALKLAFVKVMSTPGAGRILHPDAAGDEFDSMAEGAVRIAAAQNASPLPECLCATQEGWPVAAAPRPPAVETPKPLGEAHAVFRKWLGAEYDLGALDTVLAAAAVERLDGDPVWLLVVSGSGNAKTETVVALAGAGAFITSTIASEGALLSATSRKEQGPGATGGLLRKIGDRGVLVIKDFTSIISMNRDLRTAVLAAVREVYDGRWERNVGTDGGRSLEWQGRLSVIGATTTAYDTAHSVIASMGDRFALVRMDSTEGRLAAGRQALMNVGQEIEMRAALAEAAGGVIAGMDPKRALIDPEAQEVLLRLADLVTMARTAVERDYQGNVTDAHAPEMPTRFAKMLGQILRGGLAIGLTRDQAMAAAVRVAGDSVPPLRLMLLGDILAHPGSRTSEVTKRIQKPRTTVDRELQALHMLGLLRQDEPITMGAGWTYSLAEGVSTDTLSALVTRIVSTGGYEGRKESEKESATVRLVADKSGDASLSATPATPNAVRPSPYHGPCQRCGQETIRYGDDSRGALCGSCMIALARVST